MKIIQSRHRKVGRRKYISLGAAGAALLHGGH